LRMTNAYYNENDEFAAAWLRNLIAAGHIAKGEVDERSIADVQADDLRGFSQHHFFAGIGVWSYSLRLAGWPDDRPIWTGSCPCQPFSAAGQRKGFDDARHLWPEWFRLIRLHRPESVLGEQVGSALEWLDLVSGDLEGEGYAVGAAIVGAHSVGAPHIRQRIYWVANASRERRQQVSGSSLGHEETNGRARRDGSESDSNHVISSDNEDGCMAHSSISRRALSGQYERRPSSSSARLEQHDIVGQPTSGGFMPRRPSEALHGADTCGEAERPSDDVELADSDGRLSSDGRLQRGGEHGLGEKNAGIGGMAISECGRREESHLPIRQSRQVEASSVERRAAFWDACDWLPCIDGKARPVEPIAQQMADGSTESLGPLRRESIEEIEKEITNAIPSNTNSRETMRDLWKTLSTEAIRIWNTRRLTAVSDAPILLAFLRQLSEQRWAFAQSIPRSGEKETEKFLRELREQESASSSSCGRGLDEQPRGESSDIVHILSSILARHAQTAWGETFQQNARDAFPLTVGAINRVGRLRGYGNALCAPQAQAFIEAVMAECPA
jgi:site-specific DNA-cytosine methylase